MFPQRLRARDGRLRRWAVVLLFVVLAPMLAGCYGRFQLSKAVYKFNGDISSDKVVQSAVMWAFILLPVYSFASIGDAAVIHVIEYWTGTEIRLLGQADPKGAAPALALSPGGQPSPGLGHATERPEGTAGE